MASLPLVDVHTPTSSFSIVHSRKSILKREWIDNQSDFNPCDPQTVRDDTLETLFSKLSKKLTVGHSVSIVGPGWLKYEWNQSFWTLDDDSDYAIFTWRMHPGAPPPSPTSAAPPASPTLFAQKPDQALPGASEYQNPSFYAFRPKQQHHLHPRSGSPNEPNGRPRSVRSAKSRKSMRASVDEQDDYKTKFNKFHTENGVRTVTGKIGPVEGGQWLTLGLFGVACGLMGFDHGSTNAPAEGPQTRLPLPELRPAARIRAQGHRAGTLWVRT